MHESVDLVVVKVKTSVLSHCGTCWRAPGPAQGMGHGTLLSPLLLADCTPSVASVTQQRDSADSSVCSSSMTTVRQLGCAWTGGLARGVLPLLVTPSQPDALHASLLESRQHT
jgi:hypothetical protein